MQGGDGDWSEVLDQVASGVVRLDVTLCGSGLATGTGFVTEGGLIGTVAHVVDGARSIRVTNPTTGQATSGSVVGYDLTRDLALVRPTAPLRDAHEFELDTQLPQKGSAVGVIGFPLARGMQLSTGTIDQTHERRDVEGIGQLSNVLLTGATMNPGNSGGPWISRDGTVVGLAESGPPVDPSSLGDGTPERAQGFNGGISSADAAAAFAQWRQSPSAPEPCDDPSQSPVDAATDTLQSYFFDLNHSDYSSAYAQLDPSNHPLSQLADFVSGTQSSQDHGTDGDADAGPFFDLVSSRAEGEGAVLEVRFRSEQDGAHGPEGPDGTRLRCADWHLTYTFVPVGGLQLIRGVRALEGEPAFAPCAGE